LTVRNWPKAALPTERHDKPLPAEKKHKRWRYEPV